MASFFAKAREKAEQAAQQFQAQHSSISSSSSSSAPSAEPNFTYSGAVPHLLRQGIASVDPRYESNRTTHLLSGALKSLAIDHQATSRESKSLAKATYNWGQDHLPEKRDDAVGDEVIVDITDRLAYVLFEVGQLESAHSARSEQARATFKRFAKQEQELASRREKRAKIRAQLHALMPERAKSTSSPTRITQLESQLKELEDEDLAYESDLAKLKRKCVQEGFDALFDSMIELGEKMALIARYGKLLCREVPTDCAPAFPATIVARSPDMPLWPGAVRTGEIRAAIEPALQAYRPAAALPVVGSAPTAALDQSASNLARSNTVSFGVSHRTEFTTTDAAHELQDDRRASVSTASNEPPLSPLADGVPIHSHLNMSPATIPSPTRPPLPPRKSHQPPGSPSLAGPVPAGASDEAGLSTAEHEQATGPSETTVAETGLVPISGTGGPLSGTLTRRKSSTPRVSTATVAYLGPPGTYSHQAALQAFGPTTPTGGANLVPQASIGSAIDFVRSAPQIPASARAEGARALVRFAVVPLENSTFGPVSETMEQLCGEASTIAGGGLAKAEAYVIGETRLSIGHALMCGPNTYSRLVKLAGGLDASGNLGLEALAHVTEVYSHEQALGQCMGFLRDYMPNAVRKPTPSTAGAAKAAKEADSASGLVVAIAPEICSPTFDIPLLRKNIQDRNDNKTRFLVLSSSRDARTLPALMSSPEGETSKSRARALIRLFDPMSGDDEGGKSEGESKFFTALKSILDDKAGGNIKVRKVDRRPGPYSKDADAFTRSSAAFERSSVWRCVYLVELEHQGSDDEESTRKEFEDLVSRIQEECASSVDGEKGKHVAEDVQEVRAKGGVELLGTWVFPRFSGLTVQTSNNNTSLGPANQVPMTPARRFAAQQQFGGLGGSGSLSSSGSISNLSDQATPGHSNFVPSSSYSTNPSDSFYSDPNPVPPPNDDPVSGQTPSTERERKAEEARREAEEVRRMALQARIRRDGSGVGGGGGGGGGLGGLGQVDESSIGGGDGNEDDEQLPAYQPM
ncbi:PDT-domain-containing protein [Violaceomyces palustris]|uniref:PDT-domain-containing protein n=1 Tax=Violaceomyces palustris TaxID=1673888 RepID=A0ACD0P564_9BASI|nr:PDT-domain-containing protein [Violaceomyces palustris]